MGWHRVAEAVTDPQTAPDRLDIHGNPVAPDRLDAQGNPVYAPPTPTTPTAAPPSDALGLGLTAAVKSLPAATTLAEQVATSPAVPRMAATAGRVLGAVVPPVAGAFEAGPIGALLGVGGMAGGSWAGGRTGWFTGKMLQNVAAPLTNALAAVEPYAQVLTKIAGAQSALDLAQMADPTRRDIGTFGVGLHDPQDPAHPALLNLLGTKTADAVRYLLSFPISSVLPK